MMSNGDAGTKRMHVGAARAQYRDVTSHLDGVVVTDDTGAGEFGVHGQAGVGADSGSDAGDSVQPPATPPRRGLR